MTDKIATIESASKRFAEIAKVCSYQKQDELQICLRQTKSEVQLSRLAIKRLEDASTDNYGHLGTIVKAEHRETRQDIVSKLSKLEGQNLELTKSHAEMSKSHSEITNHLEQFMKRFLSSNERINPKTGDCKLHLLEARMSHFRLT